MSIAYQRQLNAQALKNHLKPCHIPDFHLMVGCAEYLAPLPVMVFQDYLTPQAKALIEPLQSMPAEKVDPSLVGITYEPNDFVYNDFFIGAAVSA